MKAVKILLFSIMFIAISFPQEGTNLPFLNTSISPQLNGAGSAATALLNDDPYSFLYNPAHIALTGNSRFITAAFYPHGTEWLKDYKVKDSHLSSYAVTIGFKVKESPWAIGIGIARSKMNFSSNLLYGELLNLVYNEDRDEYSAYSLSISYNTIISISTGFTYKEAISILDNNYSNSLDLIHLKSEVNAIDFGLIVNTPLNNFLNNQLIFNMPYIGDITTDINYTLGYAIRNVGEESYYIDKTQADPIGRKASLGQSIQADFTVNKEVYKARMIKFSYSINSDDILVKTKVDSFSYPFQKEYQSIGGDIKPVKNLFLGKGDPEVELHKGFNIELFEAVSFSAGSVSRAGEYNYHTSGYGVKLKGILKLVNIPFQSRIVKFLSEHFDLQYYQSDYYTMRNVKNKFKGMTVRLENVF